MSAERDPLRPSDAGAAAQLVAFGLQPRVRPANDAAYGELTERYRTDPDFGDLVEQVADGLGLAVLDATAAHGIVLAPTTGSVFAQRLADYRANMTVQVRLPSSGGAGYVPVEAAELRNSRRTWRRGSAGEPSRAQLACRTS